MKRSAPSLNLNLRVMTMMRMVLEITMVLAVVLGMVVMTKVTAKENEADKTLPGNENGDNDSKNGGE
jgi:hypothetical protein